MGHISLTPITLVDNEMRFPIFAEGSQKGFISIELTDLGKRNLQIKVFEGPLAGKYFEAWDYFSALTKLRLALECEGFLIGCVGSMKNFYPSNMSLDMGLGKVGYFLEIGKKVGRSAPARVFDECDDVNKLATVESQKFFFENWRSSITK